MNLETIKNNIYCRAPFIGHCINKCGENFCCHSYNKNNLSLNEKRKLMCDGNINDICKICTFKNTFNDEIYDDTFNINLKNYNINDGSVDNFKVGYMIFCPTFKCNAECIMCNTFQIGKNENELLHIENYYSKENLSTIKTLILQGGEVMMFPHIFKVIDKLIPKNCQLCVITNGMFYNDEILEILNTFNKIHLIFSLDGNSETNDLFRTKTNYNTIIKNMKKIYDRSN